MVQKKLKDLKKGEWFTLKPIENPTENQVYVKGDYVRSDNRYECSKWSDFCYTRYFLGNKLVYVDFTF